jgi:glycosyltransferase involved in cell wall biosynthesis
MSASLGDDGTEITVVIPCKDEAQSLGPLLEGLQKYLPAARVIVVDDGSSDSSAAVAEAHGAIVVSRPYSMGNGAAIKAGLRAASTSYVLCMDGDGQHRPEDAPALIQALLDDHDMAVGARSARGQAGVGRSLANAVYNRFASMIVGHRILDLTSGMRAMERDKALEFLHLLPNGFSYPTTLTMAFFRAGYAVSYVPISVQPRKGQSHISPLKDSIRFLLIIFKVGTLYSPLKIFFPMSVGFLVLGIGYYMFTYMTIGRFTNMGALLFLSSAMTFLMGLISEQITSLMYQGSRRD